MIDVLRIQRCRSMSTYGFQVSFFVIWDLRWEERCTTPPGSWTKKLQGWTSVTNPSKTKPVSFPVGTVNSVSWFCSLWFIFKRSIQFRRTFWKLDLPRWKRKLAMKVFYQKVFTFYVKPMYKKNKAIHVNHAKKPKLFHFLSFVPYLEFLSCLLQ